ncbi:uncharacterized protein LOC113063637 [Carassius auratus]|uniref:Uncharacterized protein LOC113063637 n=1 Tax=Carassius auratus TaxID=7957 RepID=A0A6P6M0Y7_CARAU|nr:uncharacterized protein LOC113063637 [Carassius auratus]
MPEHRHHIVEFLKCLREYLLFLKAKKCPFHQTSVQFLGYNNEGKIAAIKNWPIPTTIKELQRFLGFSDVYRRFIHNYSSIACPLTSLLKNKPSAVSETAPHLLYIALYGVSAIL